MITNGTRRGTRRTGRSVGGATLAAGPVPTTAAAGPAVEDVPPDLNVYDSDVLEDGEVPLARLLPGRPGRHGVPPRIVLYRRPLEFRAADREDLADLVHDVIVEQVANLLGVAPEDLD